MSKIKKFFGKNHQVHEKVEYEFNPTLLFRINYRNAKYVKFETVESEAL